MKLKALCTACGKPLELLEEATIGSEVIKHFKCGHFTVSTAPVPITPVFTSVDHSKKARKYQEDGIKFIIDSGFNCIVADQMRLGKTPQALLAVASDYKNRTPLLLIVKSANVWQWIREFKTWTDSLPNGIWPIQGSKAWIPPGFSCYIISMDTFARINTQLLLDFGFKQVIIDEAHGFKNPSSKRSIALISFLTEIAKTELDYELHFHCMCGYDWFEEGKITITNEFENVSQTTYCPKCGALNKQLIQREKAEETRKCSVIFLTGTPIKNNAGEFFVPLNILAPDKFSSRQSFEHNWLYLDDKTNKLRVQPYKIDQFQKVLSKFMIRREKEDVYTDLPLINRNFTIVKIEDEALKQAYNKVLDTMEAKFDSLTYFNGIGELMLLRQICGLGKLDNTQEYAEEFLDNSENGKIAIGLHHHAVRGAVRKRLEKYGVVSLSGEDNPYIKDRIMRTFETDSNRVLAINMLAGGVGMDFHYIDNVCVLERQWSSADEEQFEFRFYNPDRSIKNTSTQIEYLIAEGTIDEWFYNLVENKRQIFGETMGSQWTLESDAGSFKQLMEMTINSRLK